ncbi:oxidoreductase [Aspergillus coremiiformis]|uniref:Oxidoreductase n=1 Tax=Aspergillus coremiiformis TaxID=138285 RepID=A0A5N6ZGJ8_9EURO|nr:oxidoreductase [Aspergillus coremiiformis]
MTTQRAIMVQDRGQLILANVPVLDLPDDYILVKTKAVALNPTDWRHVDAEPCTGTIVGCDYAGVVEAVGAKVQKPWKKGDRVAGFVHGCNPRRPMGGAFAEYVMAKGDLQIHVPDFMSFDEAACLGVGMTTVGQNLYQSLDLSRPGDKSPEGGDPEETTSILIYGGATATGSLAIQFAKLSGLRVVTTCSEANRAFMYKLGAESVFDYHDAQVGQRIREDTDDALELVLDTISTPQSAAICAAAISSAGGCYNALLDVRCPRADVDTHVSMAYGMVGETYEMGGKEFQADSGNVEFGIAWSKTVEGLLQDRCIVPHPFHVKAGGLAGIPEGLQLLRQGKVRASKLVYQVEETE